MTVTPAIRNNLGVVFKIAERCNLACRYCYFFFHGDEDYKIHPSVVNMDVVDALGRFLRDAALTHGMSQIAVGFHGGEPLLVKKAKFDEMCTRLRAHAEGAFELNLNIQTNGVLIDEEWVDIFERHQIRPGVSIDGPPEVNDRYRLTHKRKSSYEGTRAGWDLLQKAHAAGRLKHHIGVLCVIDPEADGAQVYHHFVDEMGARSLNFLKPHFSWDDAPTEEYKAGVGRFRNAVFREWLKGRDYKIRVRFVNEAVAPMLYAGPQEEHGSVFGDLRNLLTISSNGDIAPEDVIRTLEPRFQNMKMNVATHRLEDVAASAVWQEMGAAIRKRPKNCEGCSWWTACGGGYHLAHRFSRENGFDNSSIYCGHLKDFFAEVAAHLVKAGMKIEQIEANLASRNPTGIPASAPQAAPGLVSEELPPAAVALAR